MYKQLKKNQSTFSFEWLPWIQYPSVELHVICLGLEGQNFSCKAKTLCLQHCAVYNTDNYLEQWCFLFATEVDAHGHLCLLTLSRDHSNLAHKPSKFKASVMIEQYLHTLHTASRKKRKKGMFLTIHDRNKNKTNWNTSQCLCKQTTCMNWVP